ncbi:MAG: RNHCP domain-containing protein [Oscillospiraceae bacterium]|nr:RNHCP domain-containing protein [Oscillospiraceae bacterium]
MKKKIIYKNTNKCDGFTCKFCGWAVSAEGGGTQNRNHCPNCLSSLHLDNEPGDRAADCGGIMEAVGIWVRSGGEWAVIHRCKRCGEIHSNRVAADDSPVKLMAIALRPLANPPFPPERIEEISKALDNVK